MTAGAPLMGPQDAYLLAFEVTVDKGGRQPAQPRVQEGVPLWEVGVELERPRLLVAMDGLFSLVVQLGPNGFTVSHLKVLSAHDLRVEAVVTAQADAPDWLPAVSRYEVFAGNRVTGAQFGERFIPLAGLVGDPPDPTQGATPLDRLAVAVGRSIARANATLSRQRGGTTALVTSVTMRVLVNQTELGGERLLVTLARPGQTETGQFVEFTMTTLPNQATTSGLSSLAPVVDK
jgi:hypothetical protein